MLRPDLPPKAWPIKRNIDTPSAGRGNPRPQVSSHDAASRSMTVASQWTSHNAHLSLVAGSHMPAEKERSGGDMTNGWSRETYRGSARRRGESEHRQWPNFPSLAPEEGRQLT